MKIALLGYGKMGKTVEKLATEKGHEIVLKYNSLPNSEELKKADVAIDFSVPEAAEANITSCFEAGIPVVSGTTGWLKNYEEVLKKCEECNGSFIYASNFSIGVNLFFELNRQLAVMMSRHKEYLVDVEEIHHTQKLDAPSGTAISLANDIVSHSRYNKWRLIENERDGAAEDEFPIFAKRIDDVKGTHIIDYTSSVDTISIKHQAHSRDGFALGAILAAEWILNKKGVYTMKDVLGI